MLLPSTYMFFFELSWEIIPSEVLYRKKEEGRDW